MVDRKEVGAALNFISLLICEGWQVFQALHGNSNTQFSLVNHYKDTIFLTLVLVCTYSMPAAQQSFDLFK
jgi:hypothetical protein